MSSTPFEGLPPPRLPPGSALVFQASLWWAAAAYGPRQYEWRAREQLEITLALVPADLSPVHAAVRDAARACLLAPTDVDLRLALGRALDAVIEVARRAPPAPVRHDLTPADDVWWV